MSRGQVAAKVAANKEKHPERYCPAPQCLWRTGGGYCPRHTPATKPVITPANDSRPELVGAAWVQKQLAGTFGGVR
jgi:hypothetical protein